MFSLLDAYTKMIDNNGYEQDARQLALINILEKYRIILKSKRQRIARALKINILGAHGLYIWGGVGRGKSFIVDLFYKSVKSKHKKQFHFHIFMLSFHNTSQLVREQNASLSSEEIIKETVREILPECSLLYLDELQVNNIADAMIMKRLFRVMHMCGIFIIITSNRKPEDLFLDGLNREQFLLFINNLQENFDIFNLDGPLDYRYEKTISLKKTYFHPLNKKSIKEMDEAIRHLFEVDKMHEEVIPVDDERNIKVLRCCGHTAFFLFAELCDMPLWAADYNAICHHFKNLVITGIPKLRSEDHNQALRFITLIDCLYANKTRLICSAEVAIDNLYSGYKNKFEFDRTISRLHEMQSKSYLTYESDGKIHIDQTVA